MQIFFEDLPLDITWNPEAIEAMRWNFQVIMDCKAKFTMMIINASQDVTSKSVKAEIYGLPDVLSSEQKKKFAKTIVRFLQFHGYLCEDFETLFALLRVDLEVVFVYDKTEDVLPWEEFKDLV